jgi:diguanylate cyclase (GGDEF)-like protein/PAS domain S-box-containing protein
MPEAASERILILDDERSILEMFDQLLGGRGYPCTCTSSPEEALEELRSGQYGVLITDIKMPQMNGIEVVRHARALDNALSIVMMTAVADISLAVQAIRAGADDYLLKPFDLRDVVEAVEKALGKRAEQLLQRRYQTELEHRISSATGDLEQVNRELRETKEYLESLLDSTLDAIFTTDMEGTVTYVNIGAVDMLGIPPTQLVGKPMSLVCSADPMSAPTVLAASEKGRATLETELRSHDGVLVPVIASLSIVRDARREPRSLLAICKDITEQRRLQAELRDRSQRDDLTKLYNQRYFHDCIESEFDRARRQRYPLSLMLFDLDDFKVYNDTRGHLEGDRVLETVGKVVLLHTRTNVDTGYRYGGDEFIVILPETDAETAALIAERIRSGFEKERLDTVTMSIGLITYTGGDCEPLDLVRSVDARMYEAKRRGGNQVCAVEPAATKPA